MSKHALDDLDNGGLDGAQGPPDDVWASSPPPSFEERYADKLEAIDADLEAAGSGDLEARVEELESVVRRMAEVVMEMRKRAGQ